MKYRIFSVLMVLAMVASLCVVAAAPAAAQVDVEVTDIALSSQMAGASKVGCDITIQVKNAGGVPAGAIVTFNFHKAFDLTAMNEALDEVDAANKLKYFTWNGVKLDDGSVTITGNNISVTVPAVINQFDTPVFRIAATAGLGNPDISQETEGSCLDNGGTCLDDKCKDKATPDSLYNIMVNNMGADTVEIYDYVRVSDTSLSIGDSTTVTGVGFSPNSTLHLSGALVGSGIVGPDGTAEITAQFMGQKLLTATDTTGRSACKPAGDFTMLPTLEVTPGEGPVCTPIIIEGFNYGVAPAMITIGGQDLCAGPGALVDLDKDGVLDDFRITTATIPSTLASGQYMIVAGAGSTWFDVDGKLVTVSPAAGPPGAMVTIEGSGFCPTESPQGCAGYAIMMYGQTVEGGMIVEIPIQVNDLGSFIATGKIPDDATDGLHGVMVYFNNGSDIFNPAAPGFVSAQGTFTVTDRVLTVVPSDNIPFGTTVTMSGGDFGSDAAGHTPVLLINYQQQGANEIEFMPLSSSGDIVPVTFQVTPNDPLNPGNGLNFRYGDNIIQLQVDLEDDQPDGTPGKGIPDMTSACTLTVDRPTLDITPNMGPRGTVVEASGGGWLTGQTDFVTIYYQQTGGSKKTFAIVKANAQREIATQFTIPPMQMVGQNEIGLLIWAEDANDNESLKSIFTVTVPTVKVEPDHGAPGDDITVIGSGFRPKNQVQEVSIADAPIVPIYELGLTDATGSFTVHGTVPGVMEGGQVIKVRVTQNEGDEITVPFTVSSGEGGDVSVEDGLKSIAGLYTKVWTFNAETQEWQVYDTSEGAPDDFSILNSGQGYWIQVSEDCTLRHGANTWNLKKGWNLIGWLS